MADCPLCDKQLTTARAARGFQALFECPRCGRFSTNTDLDARLPTTENRHLLSGATRNASDRGDQLKLTTDNAPQLISAAPKASDVGSKARMLLRLIVQRSKVPGSFADVDTAIDYPVCYASGEDELHFLLTSIKDLGWINWISTTGPQRIDLTAAGWTESDRAPRVLSDKAFVAMWFTNSTVPAYTDGIKLAVELCGYRPLRIDLEQHNEMIDDQIQAEIRESRFLVADLTGQRNGVHFEAGFALGREIPVIWTRWKDDPTPETFDTRQYNRIEYDTPAQLREALELRIRATIGRGPLRRDEETAPKG